MDSNSTKNCMHWRWERRLENLVDTTMLVQCIIAQLTLHDEMSSHGLKLVFIRLQS